MAGYYYKLLINKQIKPALAIWFFFLLEVTLSLSTYLKEGNFGIWDNILNTADLFYVDTINLMIILFADKSGRFNRFDVFCIALVAAILIFWFFT